MIDKLKARMETLVVGDPLDKNTDIGAINSKEQLDRITALVEAGEAEGGCLWQSGQALPGQGYWFRPSLFTETAQSHRIVQEEIFGPVLTIQTFRTLDEAVKKANNTPYGLSGGVWTDKGSKIFEVTSRLEAGIVWANTFNKFDPSSPFGGYKESGLGREGGIHGLAAYVQ
jgi:aldehyde dehydrogenase (NAD+)